MAVTAESVVVELEARFDRFRSEARQAAGVFETSMGSVQRAGDRVRGGFDKLNGAIAALGVAALARALVGTAAEFQKLQVQLEIATGSTEGASRAFEALKTLAKETPFSLQDVTEAFINLKNLGLDPSAAAIVAYGNTAGALGKTLDQVVQGVADATVGEFERLKEFGIRASAEGEKVSFTFKGVTTTVGNNAKEIEGFLRQIGETNFAGGMEKQARTIGGSLSNLGDAASQTAVKFGDGGFSGAIQEVVVAMADTVSSSGELATELGGLAGDAVTAALEVVRSFGGMSAGAADSVRDIRSTFSGLAALGDTFDPLLTAGKFVFNQLELDALGFTATLRATLDELDALSKFSVDYLGGGLIGGKATTFGKDFDAAKAKRERQLRSERNARIIDSSTFAGNQLSVFGGMFNGGTGDPLAGFADNVPAGPTAASKKAAAAAAKKAAAEAKRIDAAAEREAERKREVELDRVRLFGTDVEPIAKVKEGITSTAADAKKAIAEIDGTAKTLGETLEKAFTPASLADLTIKIPNLAAELDAAIAIADRFAEDLSRNLGQAIVQGQSLGDALVNSIKAASAQLITSGLLDLLGGSRDANGNRTGGAIASIATAIGSIFGARANGGPVTGGRPYLVGERGPELMIPSANGNIRPAGSFGGASAPIINQYLNVSLAGNAATREDAILFATIARDQAVAAFQSARNFGVPSV